MALKVHILVLKSEKMEWKEVKMLYSPTYTQWEKDQKKDMMHSIYFITDFDNFWHKEFLLRNVKVIMRRIKNKI